MQQFHENFSNYNIRNETNNHHLTDDSLIVDPYIECSTFHLSDQNRAYKVEQTKNPGDTREYREGSNLTEVSLHQSNICNKTSQHCNLPRKHSRRRLNRARTKPSETFSRSLSFSFFLSSSSPSSSSSFYFSLQTLPTGSRTIEEIYIAVYIENGIITTPLSSTYPPLLVRK